MFYLCAKRMFEETGCVAVSIGRGAFYNPWIFQQAAHYIATNELLPAPTFELRLGVVRRHLDLMVEVFGEERGCLKFRKVALQYSRAFGPTKEFDRRVVLLRTRAEFDEIVAIYRQWRAQFVDAEGELRSAYRPQMPLPAGPQELW